MKNIKVKFKMLLIMTGVLVILLFGTIFSAICMKNQNNESVAEIEGSIRSSYDDSIKSEVTAAVSVAKHYYGQYKSGILTEQLAKKNAADEIRDMRYGDSGYFWVDQSDGTNVVLLGSDTEGTNRMNTKDSKGFTMVKQMIEDSVKNNEAYTNYYFPKEGETEPSPKRSYTYYYKEFDWVIGTGNYTDDIDKTVAVRHDELTKYSNNMTKIYIAVNGTIGIVLIAIIILIIANIVKPLEAIGRELGVLESGDITSKIDDKYLKRRDDFGILANRLESMRANLSRLIGDVKTGAGDIKNVVGEITNDMGLLNSDIEDVSATTEEVAGINGRNGSYDREYRFDVA